ncbi:MAG: hypothetical protein KBC57_02495 [Neisseriaceae bacterium]|nr:hypothetical protein [Neisseriaceae bacterium]
MDMNIAVFGDRFKQYAHLVGGITLSELRTALQAGAVVDEVYEVFQGVSKAALSLLQQQFALAGKSDQLMCGPDQEAVPQRWVHKAQQSNVLISPPREAGPNRFEMNLVVDHHNEMVLDHLSGFHVQGMVLIEAARQAFLAVTENYLLPHRQGAYYFIIERLDAQYHAFVFPLYCGILFQLTDQQDKPHKHSYEADIQFWQNGSLCTLVQVKYAVYEAAELLPKEQALAVAARQQQALEPRCATAVGGLST